MSRKPSLQQGRIFSQAGRPPPAQDINQDCSSRPWQRSKSRVECDEEGERQSLLRQALRLICSGVSKTDSIVKRWQPAKGSPLEPYQAPVGSQRKNRAFSTCETNQAGRTWILPTPPKTSRETLSLAALGSIQGMGKGLGTRYGRRARTSAVKVARPDMLAVRLLAR